MDVSFEESDTQEAKPIHQPEAAAAAAEDGKARPLQGVKAGQSKGTKDRPVRDRRRHHHLRSEEFDLSGLPPSVRTGSMTTGKRKEAQAEADEGKKKRERQKKSKQTAARSKEADEPPKVKKTVSFSKDTQGGRDAQVTSSGGSSAATSAAEEEAEIPRPEQAGEVWNLRGLPRQIGRGDSARPSRDSEVWSKRNLDEVRVSRPKKPWRPKKEGSTKTDHKSPGSQAKASHQRQKIPAPKETSPPGSKKAASKQEKKAAGRKEPSKPQGSDGAPLLRAESSGKGKAELFSKFLASSGPGDNLTDTQERQQAPSSKKKKRSNFKERWRKAGRLFSARPDISESDRTGSSGDSVPPTLDPTSTDEPVIDMTKSAKAVKEGSKKKKKKMGAFEALKSRIQGIMDERRSGEPPAPTPSEEEETQEDTDSLPSIRPPKGRQQEKQEPSSPTPSEEEEREEDTDSLPSIRPPKGRQQEKQEPSSPTPSEEEETDSLPSIRPPKAKQQEKQEDEGSFGRAASPVEEGDDDDDLVTPPTSPEAVSEEEEAIADYIMPEDIVTPKLSVKMRASAAATAATAAYLSASASGSDHAQNIRSSEEQEVEVATVSGQEGGEQPVKAQPHGKRTAAEIMSKFDIQAARLRASALSSASESSDDEVLLKGNAATATAKGNAATATAAGAAPARSEAAPAAAAAAAAAAAQPAGGPAQEEPEVQPLLLDPGSRTYLKFYNELLPEIIDWTVAGEDPMPYPKKPRERCLYLIKAQEEHLDGREFLELPEPHGAWTNKNSRKMHHYIKTCGRQVFLDKQKDKFFTYSTRRIRTTFRVHQRQKRQRVRVYLEELTVEDVYSVMSQDCSMDLEDGGTFSRKISR